MGLPHRMAEMFRVKANTALNRAEDPRELLDYSYALQRDLLSDVRRSVVDVATARRRAEERRDGLRRSAAHLQEQAEKVLAAGHADLARDALAERARLLERIDRLDDRIAALRAEEERLTAAAGRLQAKVEAFSHDKEALKARYTLAEAETYVDETVSGISADMAGEERAEDRTAEAHARAEVLDELLETGTLRDPLLDIEQEPVRPDLQARLDRAATGAAVDEELDRMRARMQEERSQPPTCE